MCTCHVAPADVFGPGDLVRWNRVERGVASVRERGMDPASLGRRSVGALLPLGRRLLLWRCGSSSFFSSLTLSESRGDWHEVWSLAHWAARMRAACLIGLPRHRHLSISAGRSAGGGGVCPARSETCCDLSVGGGSGDCCLLPVPRRRCCAAPLEVGGQIARRFFSSSASGWGLRTRGPVLHEIVIGAATAGLAAAGEFRVAFGELAVFLPWSSPSRPHRRRI